MTTPSTLERVHFFPRQLLTADDMDAEQHYFRQKLRRHTRFLHGWGVVCGCEVKPAYDTADPTRYGPWTVWVCPGYVVTPQGDETWIADPFAFDLAGDQRQGTDVCAPTPCPPSMVPAAAGSGPTSVYLAVRYIECLARPVRVHPVGCACDDTACDYSRVRDGYELGVLSALPASHQTAATADAAWCAQLKVAVAKKQTLPLPPCAPCSDDPWVVLARITLPAKQDTPLASGGIDLRVRHVLYSAHDLAVLDFCAH